MYVQINVVDDQHLVDRSIHYRKAMGIIYQEINDSPVWDKVDAIHHDYAKRSLTLDLAQSDLTDDQQDWLFSHTLVGNWGISWDKESDKAPEINPSQIAIIAIETLQAEGITTWGEGGRLGDALLRIKDMMDDIIMNGSHSL